jgi:hypothetical protein
MIPSSVGNPSLSAKPLCTTYTIQGRMEMEMEMEIGIGWDWESWDGDLEHRRFDRGCNHAKLLKATVSTP